MDVSDASYYIQTMKNNENKGSQMGHTKKKKKIKLVLKILNVEKSNLPVRQPS
jgi:hypothetical protein